MASRYVSSLVSGWAPTLVSASVAILPRILQRRGLRLLCLFHCRVDLGAEPGSKLFVLVVGQRAGFAEPGPRAGQRITQKAGLDLGFGPVFPGIGSRVAAMPVGLALEQ